MPLLARWTIKTALIYFAIALLVGVLLVMQPVLGLVSWIAALRPVFLHLLIVGWITQLIMGVAYWMFPKYTKEKPRGNTYMGWLVFILLNLGLVIRAICEPLFALQPNSGVGVGLAAAAVLQVAAGWLFIANTWARVKER